MTTYQIEYEHSNTADHINLLTRNLEIEQVYGLKRVHLKNNRVGIVEDANRVLRVFSFTANGVTAADMAKLEGYLRPASAPDYSTAYPRFVKIYYGDTDQHWDNVEVVGTRFKASQAAEGRYNIALVFHEKTG